MRAMVLEKQGQMLRMIDVPRPEPAENQVLIQVKSCGVCRTDLHVVDGELTHPNLPLIPGHQVVGEVIATGPQVNLVTNGQRVGIPWLGWTCGGCDFCSTDRENLCEKAKFTGYDLNGGFAEYTVADQRYCFPIPQGYPDLQAAPLLCAGLIGYRSLKMTGDAQRLGFYGFGAAAHILIQVARFQGRQIYAFTRPGDQQSQRFALELGATWAGGSDQKPPQKLDAVIIFAPVGALVPTALRALTKGGVVVCAGIYMSDIPQFAYEILWQERVIRSVANLTRQDGQEFFALAPKIPVKTHVTSFPLGATNEALNTLRSGKIDGAAVIVPNSAE